MNHSFDVDHAVKFGVPAAIIISHLQFWIRKNEANKHHFYDGKYWTYNSIKAFTKLFPYWSKGQIERQLKKLMSANIVITANYNKSTYDRTVWYSFSDHFLKTGNGFLENGNTIPDKKTHIEENNLKEKTEFNKFWNLYDKKVGDKDSIFKKWLKLKLSDIEKIFNTLPAYKGATPDKKFRKNPATYLNQKSWNDEIIDTSPGYPQQLHLPGTVIKTDEEMNAK
jgi:hypothetical protein